MTASQPLKTAPGGLVTTTCHQQAADLGQGLGHFLRQRLLPLLQGIGLDLDGAKIGYSQALVPMPCQVGQPLAQGRGPLRRAGPPLVPPHTGIAGKAQQTDPGSASRGFFICQDPVVPTVGTRPLFGIFSAFPFHGWLVHHGRPSGTWIKTARYVSTEGSLFKQKKYQKIYA